jgi:hypothetical protein
MQAQSRSRLHPQKEGSSQGKPHGGGSFSPAAAALAGEAHRPHGRGFPHSGSDKPGSKRGGESRHQRGRDGGLLASAAASGDGPFAGGSAQLAVF